MIGDTVSLYSATPALSPADRVGVLIYKLASTFPFDFFPNQILIHWGKVDLAYKSFFAEQVLTIPIEQIKGVSIYKSLFFATLSIEVIGSAHIIKFLQAAEANHARRIISGLIVCHNSKMDLSHLPPEALRNKLDEIGRAGTSV